MVFIRRELGTRLRLKRIPDLHVRLDDSIERGTRILQVLDSIETGRDAGEATPGESLPTPSRGAAPAGAAGGVPGACHPCSGATRPAGGVRCGSGRVRGIARRVALRPARRAAAAQDRAGARGWTRRSGPGR